MSINGFMFLNDSIPSQTFKYDNQYFVEICGDVRTDGHDYFVVPLNDGAEKPNCHEYGNKMDKF